MEGSPGEIPILQTGEKVVGSAYLTEDGEIVLTYHPNSREVVLVEPQTGASGPWAVRLRPAARTRNAAGG